MRHRSHPLLTGLALACLVAGCQNRSDVSLTGNAPAQYSHVWITTQEVWFNQNGTAGPNDGGWARFTLSTPATIDLVTVNGGNLSSITSGLRLAPGTYSQVRLIPLDPYAPLATTAQTAGALYNAEADYVDGSGSTHQLPLEMLNPGFGIGIATSLKVPIGSIGVRAALAGGLGAGVAAVSSTSGTAVGGTTALGTTATPLGSSSGTSFGIGASSSSTGASSTSAPANSFVVAIDGVSDLVPFTYAANTTGILLSSHASAHDLTQSGGISGQLSLTNITTSTSGLPAIQVSAEVLSADSSRHEVVASTAVQSDGSFLLYPLPATSSGTDYDLVIHGPGIATQIIKSVQVTLASSTSTAAVTTTPTTATSTTSSSTNSSASNVTAIGTLTPRAASASYTATLTTASALPAGSLVKFYQTINRSGEVPYVIEQTPVEPFSGTLFSPQSLTVDTIDSGTWTSSTSNVTLVSAAAAEGKGAFVVAASAPSFSDGPLTPRVTAPASGTGPVAVTLTALALAPGSGSGTLTATVSQATPGKYSQGELLVSYAGTLVTTVLLNDAAFAASGTTVTVNNLPAQTPTSLYGLTVRAWNASGALQVQSYPAPVDMRGSATAAVSLSVN